MDIKGFKNLLFTKAKNEEITIVGLDTSSSSENYMMSYAIDRAAIQLMKEHGFKFQYNFSSKKDQDTYNKKYSTEYSKRSAEIRAGGYKIYTSLNPKIQKRLQKSVSKTLSTFTEKSKKTKICIAECCHVYRQRNTICGCRGGWQNTERPV